MRMLNKLFTLEKNRTDSNDTLPSGKSKTNRGSSGREKKNSRRNKSNRGDDDDDVGRRADEFKCRKSSFSLNIVTLLATTKLRR